MAAIRWLGGHDPGFRALRRAARAAVVMPVMFAVGDVWIGNPTIATFAAFGSFAMVLLVDFPGPVAARAQAQVALAACGSGLVCLGTLASRSAATAVAGMALVAFAVVFAGVVSSVVAGAATPLLLAFILPVSIPAPASQIPDRLAGWDMAAAAALVAVTVLWPAPARDPVRAAAFAACRAIAERLRADVAFVRSGRPDAGIAAHDAAVASAEAAVSDLQAVFYATPYRPTGLSTAARTIVRLVDELKWLDGVVRQGPPRPPAHVGARVCTAKLAVAAVLDRSAELVSTPGESSEPLHAALADLEAALAEVEVGATRLLPDGDGDVRVDGDVVSALDPSFRVQELAFVASQIARNVDLAAAAERRSWLGQLLGRQPAGLPGRLASVQERAGSHVDVHSVSLRNSVRAAVSLGLAVLVINLTNIQHSFWVVLGTLAVLRSNALSTGESAIRGLLGTTAGLAIGAALTLAIGTDHTLLWALLPPAILLAGLAPAAVSFAAGQAAFSIVLLILFNIIAPEGWRIGIVRIDDVALGSAVSLAVGLLFWPRGAAAALGAALADAYAASAAYLASAVRFGVSRCDADRSEPPPSAESVRAAAAARRLDDTFRAYLTERGAKPLPLADVTSLVTGVVGLRLAGDAVVELWSRNDGAGGERTAARARLLASADAVSGWYAGFAAGLAGAGLPEPQTGDVLAPRALAEAVGRDLRGGDGGATAAAVRMIWTGDHLDAARRLELTLAAPARAAVHAHALG